MARKKRSVYIGLILAYIPGSEVYMRVCMGRVIGLRWFAWPEGLVG